MPDDDVTTLAEAFWGVARQMRRQSSEALAPWDLNPSHGRALRVLARYGQMRLSVLADRLSIAARSATEVIDALQERGLVLRQPDEADRRATLVLLTDRGTEVVQRIRSARAEEGERIFSRLSSADQRHLARILAQLNDREADPAAPRAANTTSSGAPPPS